ncbi:MAG: hypothetical protein GC137_03470 [Alphaproteobacteria bacterium]|nr:hypothetical protein [Alphaproteobacteria bacterium]
MSTNRDTAKVVDSKLILSLPKADTPVVWHLDLREAQSAGFIVEEDKRKKKFALLLKRSDGAAEEIALYKHKESAVDILMETSNALQNAKGQIPQTSGSQTVTDTINKKKDDSDRLGAILALSLIIILIAVWMLSASGNFAQVDGNSAYSASASNTPSNASEAAGVPVSADDFLNSR